MNNQPIRDENMSTTETPAAKSNALILEFIIQLLCQEDSLAKQRRLKSA